MSDDLIPAGGPGLLTDQFAADVDEPLLLALGWRTVWLHAALTGPIADALAPRDREVLALVATSAFGVDQDSVVRHLRRLGLTASAAYACLRGLIGTGLLSRAADQVDLPSRDLAWIQAHTPQPTPAPAPAPEED